MVILGYQLVLSFVLVIHLLAAVVPLVCLLRFLVSIVLFLLQVLLMVLLCLLSPYQVLLVRCIDGIGTKVRELSCGLPYELGNQLRIPSQSFLLTDLIVSKQRWLPPLLRHIRMDVRLAHRLHNIQPCGHLV